MRHKRPKSSANSDNGKHSNVTLLRHLHPYIVCRLCRGYIVECITVVECMHSFCKSCIVNYINSQDENFTCPKCGQLIHESNPWTYLAPDSALQTIIYKLVPGLQESEARKCADFYKMKGISPPRKDPELVQQEKPDNNNRKKTSEQKLNSTETTKLNKHDFHRMDEQISVHLISWECMCKNMNKSSSKDEQPDEHSSEETSEVFRPYLRLSCFATINHLRKYLAYRLYGNIDRYCEFDLFCNGRPLFKEHTLKFIAATVWGIVVDTKEKSSDSVMPIVYRNRNTTAVSVDGTDDETTGEKDPSSDMISETTCTNDSPQ